MSSVDEAELWIKSQYSAMKVPPPINVYMKRDEYYGVVFARFPSPEVATTAVTAISKKRLQSKDMPVWAKHDQPI